MLIIFTIHLLVATMVGVNGFKVQIKQTRPPPVEVSPRYGLAIYSLPLLIGLGVILLIVFCCIRVLITFQCKDCEQTQRELEATNTRRLGPEDATELMTHIDADLVFNDELV